MHDGQREAVCNDFAQLGLVYRTDPSSPLFYPTVLATSLLFGAAATESHGGGGEGEEAEGQLEGEGVSAGGAAASSSEGEGVGTQGGGAAQTDSALLGGRLAKRGVKIVTETNFRVYAYNASPLEQSLLELFVKVECYLPNMASCMLTRESVGTALDRGITAEQIYHFLSQNAHPCTLDRSRGVVPGNVSDRLLLWERERERVGMEASALYEGFDTAADFGDVDRHAKELGVWLWSDADRRMLVVRETGAGQVSMFIKRQRAAS